MQEPARLYSCSANVTPQLATQTYQPRPCRRTFHVPSRMPRERFLSYALRQALHSTHRHLNQR